MSYSLQTMGVMNITPNSFSDGGRHLGPQNMLKTLERFESLGVAILDVGAESTAPMNDAISFQEEWLRLQTFLSVLADRPWKGIISLDTYRPKTAFAFFKELKRMGHSCEQMIWNDVSGQFDEEVETFLTDYPGARYVLCHNLAPDRDATSSHMDFVNEDIENHEFYKDLVGFFKDKEELIGDYQSQVIYDPCFGFSKTYQQNLFLLDNFPALAQEFPQQSWVYGISKKSFLRRWWREHIEDGPKELLLKQSEYLHLKWMERVVKELAVSRQESASHGLSELIFRVHDPSLITLITEMPK